MSVRKRSWTTRKGEMKEAWIVDYADQEGDRHIRTFDRKKEADDFPCDSQGGRAPRCAYAIEQKRHRCRGRGGLDHLREA